MTTFRGSITMDEGAGHAFHGNQHTGGLGGVARPSGEKSEKPLTRGQQYKLDKAANVERVTRLLAEEGKRQGLAPSSQKIMKSGLEFTLNGQQFNYAGSFNKFDGKVVLYAPTLMTATDDRVRAIVAHEIGHKIFQKVLDEGEPSRVNATGAQTPAPKGPLAKFTSTPEGIAQLQREDGVTGYSKDWWKSHAEIAAKNPGTGWMSPQRASLNSAMHETFAELHMLHGHDPAKFKEVVASRPAWKEVYESAMKKSRLREKES